MPCCYFCGQKVSKLYPLQDDWASDAGDSWRSSCYHCTKVFVEQEGLDVLLDEEDRKDFE